MTNTPHVTASLTGILRSLAQGQYSAYIAGGSLIGLGLLFEQHPWLMYPLVYGGLLQILGTTVYWAIHRWKKEDEPSRLEIGRESISYDGPSPMLQPVLLHAQRTLGTRGELPVADGELKFATANAKPEIHTYTTIELEQEVAKTQARLASLEQRSLEELARQKTALSHAAGSMRQPV
jgi:hypothetical protein